MTPDIVNYFKSKSIRVMLSIGGITYVDDWNTALATNARQLGINAAYTGSKSINGTEVSVPITVPVRHCRFIRYSPLARIIHEFSAAERQKTVAPDVRGCCPTAPEARKTVAQRVSAG